MPQTRHPCAKIEIVVLSMGRWLRAVVKLVQNHSLDEGEPVVTTLSSRFPCLGAGCMGVSCSHG